MKRYKVLLTEQVWVHDEVILDAEIDSTDEDEIREQIAEILNEKIPNEIAVENVGADYEIVSIEEFPQT